MGDRLYQIETTRRGKVQEVFRPAKRRSRRVRAKCSSAWRRLVRRKLTITIVPTKDNFDDLAGWLEQSGAPVKLATGGPPVCVERLRRYHGLISAFGYGAAWVIGCQNDEDKMWLQLKFGAPHPKARSNDLEAVALLPVQLA